MKKLDLTGDIQKAAKAAGLEWALVRQGAAHEVWALAGNDPAPQRD